jgi:transposase
MYELREIINAILYQSRTGCQWDYLPHDLPPRSAAYYYFARWRDDGTDQVIHDLLRWHAREKQGRKADPSLVVLDTQSVHAAASVPAATTGKDAGKRVPGRKRCLAVDVLGLVVAVVVLAASAHENTAGIALLEQVAAHTSTVSKALAAQGFKNSVVAYGAAVGIDVEVVERNPADKGFVPQPKRWVEQTFGILSFHRRLVRDYEHRLSSSASRVYWAMTEPAEQVHPVGPDSSLRPSRREQVREERRHRLNRGPGRIGQPGRHPPAPGPLQCAGQRHPQPRQVPRLIPVHDHAP